MGMELVVDLPQRLPFVDGVLVVMSRLLAIAIRLGIVTSSFALSYQRASKGAGLRTMAEELGHWWLPSVARKNRYLWQYVVDRQLA